MEGEIKSEGGWRRRTEHRTRRPRRSGINGSVIIGRRCEDASEEAVGVAAEAVKEACVTRVEVEVEVEAEVEVGVEERVDGIQRAWRSGISAWNHQRSRYQMMRRRSR